MGHKDYHNYAKPYKKPYDEPEIEEVKNTDSVEDQAEETLDPVVNEDVEETVEAAPELPTTVTGVVSGCKKLNVRFKPRKDATIVTTIDEGAEVVIEQPVSDDVFYKVTLVSGITGYCMKKFITVK